MLQRTCLSSVFVVVNVSLAETQKYSHKLRRTHSECFKTKCKSLRWVFSVRVHYCVLIAHSIASGFIFTRLSLGIPIRRTSAGASGSGRVSSALPRWWGLAVRRSEPSMTTDVSHFFRIAQFSFTRCSKSFSGGTQIIQVHHSCM